MDRDHNRRFDDRRGGESYRPTSRTNIRSSLGYTRHARSPPRNRSPRLVADTWVPSPSRAYIGRRVRSRSPPAVRRRSRSPPFHRSYGRMRTPRKFSPIRNERARSPSQAIRRSRSPYADNRLQNAPLGALKQFRGPAYSDEDTRFMKRESFVPHGSDRYSRPLSPARRGIGPDACSRTSFQYGNPVQDASRDHHLGSTSRRRSPSLPRSAPSAHTSAPCSNSNSRRSSPLTHSDRAIITPFGFRSRSPASESTPHQRLPSARDSSPSYQGRTPGTNLNVRTRHEKGHRPVMETGGRATLVAKQEISSDNFAMLRRGDKEVASRSKFTHTTGNTPSQPKSYSIPQRHLPPPGSFHDPNSSSSQRHGPNLTLLSAPTGPRGNGFREKSWVGMPGRRVPTSAAPHGPPLGPRGGSVQAGSASEFRQNSATPILDSRPPKLADHLAGLGSIVPGGKAFPSLLDPATEKRLGQLEADRERLFEQVAESQKWKRIVIMDWNRLDRESSIGDLKSELAEGHLQCITDGESVHMGVSF